MTSSNNEELSIELPPCSPGVSHSGFGYLPILNSLRGLAALAVMVALAISVVSAHLMFRFVETPSRKASKAVQLVNDSPSAPTDVKRFGRNERASRAA